MTARAKASASLVAGLASIALLGGCSGGGFGSAQTSPADDRITSYVALGDGFTAAPYVDKTVDDDCLRSDHDYPSLLAADLGVKDFKDVSCTGVGTRALTHRTKAPEGKAKQVPQLNAVDSDTDLVTIGVGIGDSDLLHQMFDVCTAFPCTDKVRGQELIRDIDRMGQSLTDAVRAAQQQAASAQILLIGYPQITPIEGKCKLLPDLDQDELDAVNAVLDRVNGQIQAVARQTASTFIDVASVTTGHELCSDDPWYTGRKAVEDKSVAYHPKEAEQAAVAKQIKAQLTQP
jgi:hypothetical protein